MQPLSGAGIDSNDTFTYRFRHLLQKSTKLLLKNSAGTIIAFVNAALVAKTATSSSNSSALVHVSSRSIVLFATGIINGAQKPLQSTTNERRGEMWRAMILISIFSSGSLMSCYWWIPWILKQLQQNPEGIESVSAYMSYFTPSLIPVTLAAINDLLFIIEHDSFGLIVTPCIRIIIEIFLMYALYTWTNLGINALSLAYTIHCTCFVIITTGYLKYKSLYDNELSYASFKFFQFSLQNIKQHTKSILRFGVPSACLDAINLIGLFGLTLCCGIISDEAQSAFNILTQYTNLALIGVNSIQARLTKQTPDEKTRRGKIQTALSGFVLTSILYGLLYMPLLTDLFCQFLTQQFVSNNELVFYSKVESLLSLKNISLALLGQYCLAVTQLNVKGCLAAMGVVIKPTTIAMIGNIFLAVGINIYRSSNNTFSDLLLTSTSCYCATSMATSAYSLYQIYKTADDVEYMGEDKAINP